MLQLSSYTFGTMSLGRKPAEITEDLKVAQRAIDSGVWFHTSPTYNNGFTFMVLRLAFDANRQRVPKLLIKVRDGSVSLMRFEVEDTCRRLGIDTIDVAQLVSMDGRPGNLVDQLRKGDGPLVVELASLRSRGLIREAVLFLTRDNSDAAVEAVKSDLIEGVTFYWNARERHCTDAAWAAIREQAIPMLALRTVGGGPTDEATRAKADELATLIKAAGCRHATEFNLRLAASETMIRTTIGGTSSLAHLEDFLTGVPNAAPLPPDILAQVERLQVR